MSASGAAEPFKIGFLDEGMFDGEQGFRATAGRAIELRFDEAVASGEVDRPVELVFAPARGLPEGTTKAVRDAWMSLYDQGVLAIIGPGITDNCMAMVSLFEEFHVPTINYPGTTRSRGEYGFHYQIGALYDDGRIVAKAIAAAGMADVAVIRDRTPIGQEFFDNFLDQCEISGLNVTCDLMCSPIATDFTEQVARAKASSPQALVYLGFGQVLVDLSRAMKDSSWDLPRFTVSAGMHWYNKNSEERAILSGWVYIDQVDENNPVMTHVVEELRSRWGIEGFNPMMGGMYDMATLAVLGLHYATVHTPEGVKEGLERINLVPSALGEAGTVMGFGPYERTALKGQHYLFLREMRGDVTVPYQG